MTGMSRGAETLDQRRFTVEEYHRMAETGIFKPDERVELFRGVVRRMSPKNYSHVVAVTSLYKSLMMSLTGRASVFKEDPLKLVQLDSEPEPDIVVISSPDIEDYGKSRPLLVVEVADSSLRYDLNAKASLYADAGVPEYWVVNLVDRELVVFRSHHEGDYRDRATYRSGDHVAPEGGRMWGSRSESSSPPKSRSEASSNTLTCLECSSILGAARGVEAHWPEARRSSSSKKLKMNVSLSRFNSTSSSPADAITKRWPSGCSARLRPPSNADGGIRPVPMAEFVETFDRVSDHGSCLPGRKVSPSTVNTDTKI